MTTLLAANSGGHLQELYHLLPRLTGIDDDRVWVTVKSAQSESLLAAEEVVYVAYTVPRDLLGAARNARSVAGLLRTRRFTQAISTGSTVAVSVLPLARLHRARCHYIESATRIDGPSFSAKLVRPIPGIHLYTQNRAWLRKPWLYRGSVLDGFIAEELDRSRAPKRIVVTVGSTLAYGFRSLIERVVEIVPADAEVLWQTGPTDLSGLDIVGRPEVPGAELAAAVAEADVVIAHAGVGTSLVALEAGRRPILVPRRHARNEHVDDHQAEIAADLAARGLAMVREVPDLSLDDLVAAAGWQVRQLEDPAPFVLEGA